ncbi:MAG: hypothetical protein IKS87_03400, partial [Lachnospiraceae bacterium]|nr:hypothetical protein [Lachnospiraceae bacterium]
VMASEDGEYLCTIGPGQSYSTKDVVYGIYQISATNINACSGWCTNCFDGDSHTYASGKKVTSTYSILVDGFSVLNYSSAGGTSGRLDLSNYTGKDLTITMPNNYVVRQTVSCTGGNSPNGQSIESCGYSYTNSITVTGSMQLYGSSKKPELTANPVSTQAGTDQSATFSVAGNKVTSCRWQKVTEAGVTDLHDGSDEDGVTYAGTSTMQLTVSKLRTRLNGATFRCILIGERGDEVASECASLTVADTSPPQVRFTYSPSEKTYGEVSIRIFASDPDSGLSEHPYHYLDGDHDSDTFSVSKNGTYEVVVTDRAGNKTRTGATVTNIQVKPEPTSTPDVTVSQTPVQAGVVTPIPTPTIIVSNPAPVNASSSTGKTSNSNAKDQDKNTGQDQSKQNQNAAKNVNIRSLTAGVQNKTDQTHAISEEMRETEEVEEETMLSEAPEENMVPEVLDETDPIGTILGACAGVLLLLALLFLALLFPVRIENADELGNWHFCALKLLRYHKRWELHVGLLLEDFDSLKLKFGVLFLAIIGNHPLVVLTSEGEEITAAEVSQDLILHYH